MPGGGGTTFPTAVDTFPGAHPSRDLTDPIVAIERAVIARISEMPLWGVGAALSGSAPAAPGPFQVQAGVVSVTFSGAFKGTLTFPTPFTNGLLTVVVCGGAESDFTVSYDYLGSFSKTSAALYATNAGAGYSG